MLLKISTASHFHSLIQQFFHSFWNEATSYLQITQVAHAVKQLGRPSVIYRVLNEVKPHLSIKHYLICKSTLANSISRSLLSHPATPSIITCLFLNDVILAIKLRKLKCFNVNKICICCFINSRTLSNKQISINYSMTEGKYKRGSWVNRHGEYSKHCIPVGYVTTIDNCALSYRSLWFGKRHWNCRAVLCRLRWG